jgi:hypothetical protein
VTRQEAIAAGAKTYTGKVCEKHPAAEGERRIGNHECVSCDNQRHLERARDPKDSRFRAHALIRRRRCGAKQRGLDVSGLCATRLVPLIVNGRSILSGIPFRNTGVCTWDSASIDQKVAGAGYTWENIRVVLQAENMGMSNWGKDTTCFVWASVLLREAEKRGDTATTLCVLRSLVDRYRPEEK